MLIQIHRSFRVPPLATHARPMIQIPPQPHHPKPRHEVSIQYVRFLAAFVVYTVIDVGWNASPIARGMYESLYEANRYDTPLSHFGTQHPRPDHTPI